MIGTIFRMALLVALGFMFALWVLFWAIVLILRL